MTPRTASFAGHSDVPCSTAAQHRSIDRKIRPVMNNLEFASVPTPAPGDSWHKRSDSERLADVENALATRMPALQDIVSIVEARSDGQVIVGLRVPVPAGKRGTLLLDLEAGLKDLIDPALVVWLEPLGDKSSLRNLRGIEVRS